MVTSNFIAWTSLFFAVIGLVLFVRRVVIWRMKRRSVVPASQQPLPPAPEPDALTPEHRLLVISNGEQFGPYTKAEVVAMVQGGRLSAEAMCWEPGQVDWIPVKSLVA